MSFAKVNFTPTVAPADGGGGGAAGGWIFPEFGDLTLNQGSYGMTYAAGQNGFKHRVTIDAAANSNEFNRSVMGFVLIDTGKTVAQMLAAHATILSVLIKVNPISASDPICSDNGARFQFGPIITWGNSLSASKTGGYFCGVSLNATGGIGAFTRTDVGRITNSSTLATLGRNVGNDGVTTDKLSFLQLSATGMYGNPHGQQVAGFTGGDFVVGFINPVEGDARFHSLNEAAQISSSQNGTTETCHVGVCFGQRVIGANPQSKTLDFDFKYILQSDE